MTCPKSRVNAGKFLTAALSGDASSDTPTQTERTPLECGLSGAPRPFGVRKDAHAGTKKACGCKQIAPTGGAPDGASGNQIVPP
jgi:hypothetical protein